MSDHPESNSESSETSRRGKARERHERRRSRQQSQQRSTAETARVRDHLKPAGGFEMPDIDPRVLRAGVLGVGAVAFMVAIILAIGMFKSDPTEPEPNGLWLGRDWTYEVHDDDQVRQMIDDLKENRIGTVYAHVSELNFDNTWTGIPDQQNRFDEVENRVTQFVTQFRARYPDLRIYGVVNVRADVADDGYRLDDEAVQSAVASFSSRVVNTLGFDGVLLNVQPVFNNDENFLDLLRETRRGIGDDALLAVMVPPDWTPQDVDVPTPSNIAPGTVWDEEYKQRVALLRVDQVVLRVSESYLATDLGNDAADYSTWIAYQVAAYTEAIAYLENSTTLMVLVSAQDDVRVGDLVVRDASVETMSAAISGVIAGLQQAGENATVFRGLALYSSEELDSADWRQYRTLWITR